MPFMPEVYSDTGPNDSDKTLTVPARREWMIQSIRVTFSPTSTGSTGSTTGDRRLQLEVGTSDTGVVFYERQAIAHRSDVSRRYVFAPNVEESAMPFGSSTGLRTLRIPDLKLKSGYRIRIFDRNTVRSTADDLVVHASVLERHI